MRHQNKHQSIIYFLKVIKKIIKINLIKLKMYLKKISFNFLPRKKLLNKIKKYLILEIKKDQHQPVN